MTARPEIGAPIQIRSHTPWKINMEPKNEGLVQMIFLFKQVIFRFHVNFPGCRWDMFDVAKKCHRLSAVIFFEDL